MRLDLISEVPTVWRSFQAFSSLYSGHCFSFRSRGCLRTKEPPHPLRLARNPVPCLLKMEERPLENNMNRGCSAREAMRCARVALGVGLPQYFPELRAQFVGGGYVVLVRPKLGGGVFLRELGGQERGETSSRLDPVASAWGDHDGQGRPCPFFPRACRIKGDTRAWGEKSFSCRASPLCKYAFYRSICSDVGVICVGK